MTRKKPKPVTLSLERFDINNEDAYLVFGDKTCGVTRHIRLSVAEVNQDQFMPALQREYTKHVGRRKEVEFLQKLLRQELQLVDG